MRKSVGRAAALLVCALTFIVGCQKAPSAIDKAPLPSVASSPYLCGHIPATAAKLMTGVSDPIVNGSLKPWQGGEGWGNCALYRSGGESRQQVLHVILDSGGARGQVDEYLKDGGKLLPEIVPGGYGAYMVDSDKTSRVGAILVKGQGRLLVELVQGIQGRDNAADMVAFMRLIAPRLLIGDSPSPGPSQKEKE